MPEKSVVVTDLHGQDKLLQKVINFYGDSVHVVANGDVVDGPPSSNVKNTLHILGDISATLIDANHEYVLRAALTDSDPLRRSAWQEKWLLQPRDRPRYEKNTLKSYGIERSYSHEDTAKEFKDTLESLGHLAILEQAEPYFEADEMLVVHAGLAHWKSWKTQIHELDRVHALAQAHQFLDEPAFVSSFDFAMEWRTPWDLKKPLVTGHHHPVPGIGHRLYSPHGQGLRRVQLASHLAAGKPLYAYESWTQQIREFKQD